MILPWALRKDNEIIDEIVISWCETLQERGIEKHKFHLSNLGCMTLGFYHNGQGRTISVWYPDYGQSKPTNTQTHLKNTVIVC